MSDMAEVQLVGARQGSRGGRIEEYAPADDESGRTRLDGVPHALFGMPNILQLVSTADEVWGEPFRFIHAIHLRS
jgi:hypothetical protein